MSGPVRLMARLHTKRINTVNISAVQQHWEMEGGRRGAKGDAAPPGGTQWKCLIVRVNLKAIAALKDAACETKEL